MAKPYTIRPLKLGVEVIGINLMDKLDSSVIRQIMNDTHKYRIMVFRGQTEMTPDKQIEISRWFGDIDWESYYKHPKSPSKYIFRVSNDETEGCTRVGRTGWHIDGTFREAPYAISVYHMPHVPKTGDTRFVGFAEVIEEMNEAQLKKWDRLWMVADRRGGIRHPLMYRHPITGKKTLCFHTGMIDTFIRDLGTPNEYELTVDESQKVINEIHQAVIVDNEKLVYSHKWTPGDFILSDNLAVGHEAAPESQIPRSEVGLRVLHRVTVLGNAVPQK